MLVIMAPARNVRLVTDKKLKPGKPLFLSEAARLAAVLKEYDPWRLESLLDLNPGRAVEMLKCYLRFDPGDPGSPALLSYYGAAFYNMNPQDFNARELAFAQNHLRILSALYGVLRPMDGVLPHRLGMKKDFLIGGQDLYAFWGGRVYGEAFKDGGPVVNLASLEYAKLITPHLKPGDVMISCRFLIQKPGGARGTVSTIRAARGLMARYIIKNKITGPEGIKEFDSDGYRYISGLSNARSYVFIKG